VPQRTNLFQELILIIHEHTSENATVTESAMPICRITGNAREVDIYIQQQVAGHEVVVSVECRDYNKPQSVEFVDAMWGKHASLPTDKLILVSSKGFSKEAKLRAEGLGIRTISPYDKPDSWRTEIANDLRSVWAKTFRTSPKQLVLTLDWPDGAEKNVSSLVGDGSPLLYDADGVVRTNAADLMSTAVSSIDPNNDAFRDALGHEQTFELDCTEFLSRATDTITCKPIDFHIKEADSGTLIRIASAVVKGSLEVRVGEMTLKHGDFEGTGFAHGSSDLEGDTVFFVATQAPNGGRRTKVRVDWRDAPAER